MTKLKLKSALPFLVLIAIAVGALFVPTKINFDAGNYVPADIAWVIVAAALVFLMTPGLAFFYGGMVPLYPRLNLLLSLLSRTRSS